MLKKLKHVKRVKHFENKKKEEKFENVVSCSEKSACCSLPKKSI